MKNLNNKKKVNPFLLFFKKKNITNLINFHWHLNIAFFEYFNIFTADVIQLEGANASAEEAADDLEEGGASQVKIIQFT